MNDTIILSMVMINIAVVVFAQALQAFKYQAVAGNARNILLLTRMFHFKSVSDMKMQVVHLVILKQTIQLPNTLEQWQYSKRDIITRINI